ncbi:MAG: hypothetical protein AAGG08_07040 [Actinomycetota bacterium]
MRRTGMRRVLRWALAAATAVGAAVVTVAPSTPTEAFPVWPNCLFDEDDDTGLDCLPESDSKLSATVLGAFGQGNLTIRSLFTVPPCDLFTETRNCYFTVDRPRFGSCFYIDIRQEDPKGVESCGGYEDMYLEGTIETPSSEHFEYTSGTATSFSGNVSQLTCGGRYNTIFGFGGDQRTDFVWRERGPKTANCDIAVNLPVPNALQGPTFLRVSVSGRVCAPDSGGNCSKSETVTSYAWLPVFGTLDPNIEPAVDPPVPPPPPEDDEEPVEPVSPKRLADSRDDGETTDGEAEGEGLVQANTSRPIAVTGRANVPDDATGVVVNITTVGARTPGFVTVYPCDEDVPSTSSVNFLAGQVVANSAVVKLSADGEMCVFSSSDVHVIVDATAYIGDDASITTIVPVRLVETRPDEETDDGENQGEGAIEGGTHIEVDVAGRGDVPEDAEVVAANLTVIRPDGPGFASLYPCDRGAAPPTTSNVNFDAGQVRANSAIVPLTEDGTLCIFTSATADAVLDITAAISESDDFSGVAPARLLETREGQPTEDGERAGEGRLPARQATELQIGGRAGIPADADVVSLNVTAVQPSGPGFLSVLDAEFGCDGITPSTSTVNFGAGARAVANSTTVQLSSRGTVCVYAHEATHVLVDAAAFGTDDDPKVVNPPGTIGPFPPPSD